MSLAMRMHMGACPISVNVAGYEYAYGCMPDLRECGWLCVCIWVYAQSPCMWLAVRMRLGVCPISVNVAGYAYAYRCMPDLRECRWLCVCVWVYARSPLNVAGYAYAYGCMPDIHATPKFLEVPSRRPCDTLIFGRTLEEHPHFWKYPLDVHATP